MRGIAAAVIGCAAGTLLLVGNAGAVQTYPDVAGDAGGGADIRNVALTNDAAGTITLRATLASPLLAAHGLGLFVDADKRATTGNVFGLEAVLFVSPARGFTSMLRWNGSQLASVLAKTVTATVRGNVVELSIHRRELGGTRGFRFMVVTSDEAGAIYDWLPAKGMTTYDLWACSNGVDDDRDGRADFPRDRGCTSAEDDLEAGPGRNRAGQRVQ